MSRISRRQFVATATAVAATPLSACAEDPQPSGQDPIIDIHQHTAHKLRTNDQLVAHQRAMGVTTTVILPSARAFDRQENGEPLDPARAQQGGNEAAVQFAVSLPNEFVRFANELPTLPWGLQTIEHYLSVGGLGIGESKFAIDCDSPHVERLAEIAQSFKVPVLLHFQHGRYNMHLERFHRVLKKFPHVNFIGHAQTWWGNIDRNHDQTVMYPKGKVSPGGFTDRLLSEFPNMYGDLSAGSGHNALIRDEQHARRFLERHQEKLMFGSDCADTVGRGPDCTGAKTIAAVRRLAPGKEIERKILYQNAKKLILKG